MKAVAYAVLGLGFALAAGSATAQIGWSDRSYRTASSGMYQQYAERQYNRYSNQRYYSRSNQYSRSNYARSKHYSRSTRYARSKRSYHSGPSGRFPRRIQALGYRVFIFSPRYKMWAAYSESGDRLSQGRANGGSHYCADLGRPCRTPQGVFRVYKKGTAACRSKKFPVGVGGAAMPYCMYFKGGYAIHGSAYISNINGSHGCIRVQTAAAAWLHGDFIKPGTRVLVLPY